MWSPSYLSKPEEERLEMVGNSVLLTTGAVDGEGEGLSVGVAVGDRVVGELVGPDVGIASVFVSLSGKTSLFDSGAAMLNCDATEDDGDEEEGSFSFFTTNNAVIKTIRAPKRMRKRPVFRSRVLFVLRTLLSCTSRDISAFAFIC